MQKVIYAKPAIEVRHEKETNFGSRIQEMCFPPSTDSDLTDENLKQQILI